MSLSSCAPRNAENTSEFHPVSAPTSTSAPESEVDAPGAELSPPSPRPSSETAPLAGAQPLDVLPEDDTSLDITEVRAGSHSTFDRVVIELEGQGSPGWYVSTTDDPVSDGSGAPVTYDGTTALVIDVRGLEGFSDQDDDPGNTPVHNAAADVVRSVRAMGVFEGTQRVVIGLDDATPSFTVNLLDGPTRIVVDITDRG